MTDRLEAQFAFLNEADRLKSVLRATTLVDGSRPENSGEHSWHLALYALVLADQAGPQVDISRVPGRPRRRGAGDPWGRKGPVRGRIAVTHDGVARSFPREPGS